MAIMAGHRIPYAATLSVAHRDDFLRKVRHARATKGFRFLLILSPCPTGWKSEPDESTELIGDAVRSGLFPVYEIFDGVRYRINLQPDGTPIDRYLQKQRRYKTVASNPQALKAYIEAQWRYLNGIAKAFPASPEDGNRKMAV
jgi:pyruvate ferredoxin oxidoreductase beta subunit/2-oxoisovalerate ferredoxin oxidoreductase beta subunit